MALTSVLHLPANITTLGQMDGYLLDNASHLTLVLPKGSYTESYMRELGMEVTYENAAEDVTPTVHCPFVIAETTEGGAYFEMETASMYFGEGSEAYADIFTWDVDKIKTVIFVYQDVRSKHITTRSYWSTGAGSREDAYVYDLYIQVVDLEAGIRYAPRVFSETLLTTDNSVMYCSGSGTYQEGDFKAAFGRLTVVK